MEKIKIKKIYFNEKSKAGTAYKDQKGNAYQMVKIQEEGGENRALYGRGYPGSPVLSFKDGQVVDVMTDSKTDAEGKVWHNFRLPRPEERVTLLVEQMGARLQHLEARVSALEGVQIKSNEIEEKPEEIDEPPF